MAVIEIAKIQVRRGQELQTGIPQLEPGEFGWAQDTENLYIGKRISEGAVDDLNTRILTDNDLVNIFAYLRSGGTVANTSTYRYREMVAHLNATTSTIAIKLDNTVSLTDYGVNPSFTATDITTLFTNAVNDIFKNSAFNSFQRKDARRKLIIPAGNYIINTEIKLPPYTDIVGQGPEMTKLMLTNSGTCIFRTIDSQNNTFESGMLTGANKSREISISGMTLQYNTGTISNKPLISLDNTHDAVISDVVFQYAYDNISTETAGVQVYGVGISLRGNIGATGIPGTENIFIQNCRFNGLKYGIEGTGTVVRPVVSDCIFQNLEKGIYLYSANSLEGPSNAVIQKSRFEIIKTEAIHVGANPIDPAINEPKRTGHLSENNYFINVGNGALVYDNLVNTSTGITPIIRFDATGNKSINDHFERRVVANTTSSSTASNSYYYVPLVIGSTSINDESVFTATVTTSTFVGPNAELCKIPFSTSDQMVTVRYQIVNLGLSRKGTMLLNLDPNGNAAITDTYNYMEGLISYSNATEAMVAEPGSGIDLITQSGSLVLIDLVGTTATNLYITGSNVYFGLAAQITGINFDGTFFTIETASANPVFDYSTPGETFALVFSDNPEISFFVSTQYRNRNYLTLNLANGSNFVTTDVEYQLDVMV